MIAGVSGYPISTLAGASVHERFDHVAIAQQHGVGHVLERADIHVARGPS